MKIVYDKAWTYLTWVVGLFVGTPIILLVSDNLLKSTVGSLVMALAWIVVMICGLAFDHFTYGFRSGTLNSIQLIVKHKKIHIVGASIAFVLTIVSILCFVTATAILCGIWMLISILCAARLNNLSKSESTYMSTTIDNTVSLNKKPVVVFGIICGVFWSALLLSVITKVLSLTSGLEIFALSCVFAALAFFLFVRTIYKNRET